MDLSDLISGMRRFQNLSAKDIEGGTGISESRIGRFDNKDSVKLSLEELQQYASAVGIELAVVARAANAEWRLPLFAKPERGTGNE